MNRIGTLLVQACAAIAGAIFSASIVDRLSQISRTRLGAAFSSRRKLQRNRGKPKMPPRLTDQNPCAHSLRPRRFRRPEHQGAGKFYIAPRLEHGISVKPVCYNLARYLRTFYRPAGFRLGEVREMCSLTFQRSCGGLIGLAISTALWILSA